MIRAIFVGLWFGTGLFAAISNVERVQRVWGFVSPGDVVQHFLTLALGPIGFLLVMVHGGKFLFWRLKPAERILALQEENRRLVAVLERIRDRPMLYAPNVARMALAAKETP